MSEDADDEHLRRQHADMARDYAERLAQMRAGTLEPGSWDARILKTYGEQYFIRWMEERIAYWTARSLGVSALALSDGEDK